MRILSIASILLIWGRRYNVQGWVMQPSPSMVHHRQKNGVTSSSLYMADNLKKYREMPGISNKDGVEEEEKQQQQRIMDVAMKFGGSSLANADRIDHVANLIKGQIEKGYRPRAVVCSAMGKTTNGLLDAGSMALEGKISLDSVRALHIAAMDEFNVPDHTRNEVNELLDECEAMLLGVKMIQELSPKSLDQLVSYGERCSVRIMAARLNQIGVPAQSFDAWDVGMITDDNFGDARLLPECDQFIQESFTKIDPDIVAVVTGFIGQEPKSKRITTLGRGGSDLSATQIGSCLNLDEVQFWKDVDGILTSDPRIVPQAIPVDKVTYEEAAELAYFGAQVLHPVAMYPAMKRNTPLRVKNSYNPLAKGTVIDGIHGERPLVTAITYKHNTKLLDVHASTMLGQYGFLSKTFEAFEKHQVSVDVLASSEVSVSITLDKKQNNDSITSLINDLKPFADVTLKTQKSILTLITDVERSSEVLATVFRVFSTQGIKVEMMSQGASKVNISFILPDEQLEPAVRYIHNCFFEDDCVVQAYEPEISYTAKKDGNTNNNKDGVQMGKGVWG